MQQTLPRSKRAAPAVPASGSAGLDTPLTSLLQWNWETLTWIAFLVIAIVTRLWDLGGRAMSHDESLHTLYAWQLYMGKGYEHNPMMHGPFRFHLNALFYFLFGVNDFTARLPAALFGIATVILVPLLLRRYLGRLGALATGFMLLISPVILYHNRYIRDEVFVGLFALLIIVGMFRWLDDRRPAWLYLIVTSMTLMILAMESGFIQVTLFGVFAVAALAWALFMRKDGEGEPLLSRLRAHPLTAWSIAMGTIILPFMTAPIVKIILRSNPEDYTANGLTRSFIIFGVLLVVGAAIGLWWSMRYWPVMAAIFYSITLLLYTTFFTNRAGLWTGYLGSLGYWLDQHGVERGGQPEYYYAFLAPIYEFLPLWFGLAAYVFYLFLNRQMMVARGETDLSRALFVPFLMWWSFTSFIGFSVAGERMPWLLYYISLPLCFLAGRFVGDVFESANWANIRARGGLVFASVLVPALIILALLLFVQPFRGDTADQLRSTVLWVGGVFMLVVLGIGLFLLGRRLGWSGVRATVFATLFTVMALLTIRTSVYANYINDELAVEFIVYAHATPDVKLVYNELLELSNHVGGPGELRIVYDNLVPWPFEWYLRDFSKKQFVGDNPPGPIDAPVVLIGGGNDAKFRPYLRNDYVRREYNMIWWPMEEYKNQTPASVMALLSNPAERQKWFDILMWRKYPKPLSDWYHHNKFVVYTRKDLLNRIWARGAADPTLANVETAPNVYEQRRRDVTAQLILGAGQLNAPKDVAVDDKGNVYVVDSNNNRVVKYGPQGGQPLKTWGGPGSGQGQFRDGPWGIGIDVRRGFVYVADTWNGRIQKFDLEGAFITAWGAFDQAAQVTDKPTAMYGPRDVAVDADGNLFVTDTGNKRILKFDPDGKPLAQYGGAGFEPGKFQEPVGIAISPTDGSIYVADTWNKRVQKFDKDMRPQAQWNVEAWDGQSVVNKPYIAVDSRNRVYLTDPEGYRVIVLDDKGAPTAVMGQPGKDNKGVELPVGVAVAADGRIYLGDSNNNRVVQWPAVP